MKPFSNLFFSIIPILFGFATWSSSNPNLNPINSTCAISSRDDPNIDYAFCVTSLQAVPGSRCASLGALGKISIDLVLRNITETSCYIEQLIENGTWDPYRRQCLSDCSELFSDAIPAVEQAARDYEARRFDDANVHISSAMDAATTCEDGFNERSGRNSPMTKRNNDAFQLSAIVLAIIDLVRARSS
ncbi:putative invertase inhibitor [Andrographis paniculata]|uniref:putative invertase inhibitor n=1 Tax=Andrographis paniculata TaxID=175694 RepID=UPI0021E6DB2C|nr:putative invertase inhibitor [Andrographis paniculata]